MDTALMVRFPEYLCSISVLLFSFWSVSRLSLITVKVRFKESEN